MVDFFSGSDVHEYDTGGRRRGIPRMPTPIQKLVWKELPIPHVVERVGKLKTQHRPTLCWPMHDHPSA